MKNLLSEKEIGELMALLDEEHRSLPENIVVYGTPLQVVSDGRFTWEHFLRHVMKPFAAGKRAGNEIFLFPFNIALAAIKAGEFRMRRIHRKIALAYVLFHEVRHIWQEKHEPKRYREARENYVSGTENPALYDENWIESDANEFALRVFAEKKKEIGAIVGA